MSFNSDEVRGSEVVDYSGSGKSWRHGPRIPRTRTDLDNSSGKLPLELQGYPSAQVCDFLQDVLTLVQSPDLEYTSSISSHSCNITCSVILIFSASESSALSDTFTMTTPAPKVPLYSLNGMRVIPRQMSPSCANANIPQTSKIPPTTRSRHILPPSRHPTLSNKFTPIPMSDWH